MLQRSAEVTKRLMHYMRTFTYEESQRMLAHIYAIHSKKPNKYFSNNDVDKKKTVVTQCGHNFISWKYIYILIFS